MTKKRWIGLGAIAISAIILITLLMAPAAGKLNSGSSYNKAPDGYGAWYAFMEKRGTPVKRWQKPFTQLPVNQAGATFVRVLPQVNVSWLDTEQEKWVEKGNNLIILGVRSPITPAPYSSKLQSAAGAVKIETGRRQELSNNRGQRLSDRFGAVVWEQTVGKGRVIYAITPHLAANAYQDEPGNFAFLAQLATSSKSNIWIDEYIHGYKDKNAIATEKNKNWVAYLAKTPIFPLLIQAGIILLVMVIAKNHRLGQPIALETPSVDNSKAYIQALAEVLQKAQSREFVVEIIGKEEQLQLQQTLGLGSNLLDSKTLIDNWVTQTGRPAAELEQLLELQNKKRRISQQDLLTWLNKWKNIHTNNVGSNTAVWARRDEA
jgi:Domain of unknown function (DUF4350)